MPFAFSIPPKCQTEKAGLDFFSDTKSFWHYQKKKKISEKEELPDIQKYQSSVGQNSVSKPNRWSVMGSLGEASAVTRFLHCNFSTSMLLCCVVAYAFNRTCPPVGHLIKFLILQTTPPEAQRCQAPLSSHSEPTADPQLSALNAVLLLPHQTPTLITSPLLFSKEINECMK